MQIKTHKIKNTYADAHFFILSKGSNCGKPMDVPCPNCFVCICKNDEEKQKMYWLFYGLWQGLFFHPFLTGSVIPFIRLDDLKNVVKIALTKIELQPQQFEKNISMIKLLNEKSKIIQEQIILIKQAKKSLMYQILK
jgi:hypothetical protein